MRPECKNCEIRFSCLTEAGNFILLPCSFKPNKGKGLWIKQMPCGQLLISRKEMKEHIGKLEKVIMKVIDEKMKGVIK